MKLEEFETNIKTIREVTVNEPSIFVSESKFDDKSAILEEEKKVNKEMHPIEYVVDNIFYTVQD